MNALIVVDSEFGNTARVAECIAEGLAPIRSSVLRLAGGDALPVDVGPVDLLVVGGPTQNHGMSPRLRAASRELAKLARGMACATFDTRLRGPQLLTGSAAKGQAKLLRTAGARVIAPAQSFMVHRPVGSDQKKLPSSAVTLADGELDRARDWGRSLADLVASMRA